MRQIEATIDSKLTSFMECLKNQTIATTDTTQLVDTFRKAREAVMTDVNGSLLSHHGEYEEIANSTLEMPQNQPTTSTVLCRPEQRNLILETTNLETCCGKIHSAEKREVKEKKTDATLKYFNRLAGKSSKAAKTEHKTAILELMNKGTLKELKLLPTIGLKTNIKS
jgi:hypothetical protein